MSVNANKDLLAAAEYLLERHGKWMPNEDDWNALREAVRAIRQERPDEDDELVPEEFACRSCEERRIDQLIWVQHAAVHCQTCGTDYNPNPHFEEPADDHHV